MSTPTTTHIPLTAEQQLIREWAFAEAPPFNPEAEPPQICCTECGFPIWEPSCGFFCSQECREAWITA